MDVMNWHLGHDDFLFNDGWPWVDSETTSLHAHAMFNEMQQRYITNLTSAFWMGVVLSGSSATKADDEQKVSEGISA